MSHKNVTSVQGCLSENQNVAPLKGEQFGHDTDFIWPQKETIIQQSTARWHFFPFLCGYFSYTQPLVVSTLMAKSICILSWTICDLKIILQFNFHLWCVSEMTSIPTHGESPWGTMSCVHLHLTKFKILHSSQSMVSRAPTRHCTFSFHFQLFNNWMK